MTCPTADRLRSLWYATCQQMTAVSYPLEGWVRDEIDSQHKRADYHLALEALKKHFEECEICKNPKLNG
jgi:hypothetical protein